MIIQINKPRFRSKVAIFDFDWTLIKPKSGGTFPKDVDDWIWLRPDVPNIILKYFKKGFGILIATNQSKSWKKDQIVNAMTTLDIPLTIAIATRKEDYKPNLIIFNEAFTLVQRNKINKTLSFFCGDALGRQSDHSDSDLKFAENMGIKSISPEVMFPFIAKPAFDLKPSSSQEIIIMVGYQASGKSTIAHEIFETAGYFIVNGDELKTIQKMIKTAEIELKKGTSVVFDATNASKEKRSLLVNLANKYNISARCIYVQTSLEESLARNNLRQKPIPKIAFYVYRKHFEKPNNDEGFQVIVVQSVEQQNGTLRNSNF